MEKLWTRNFILIFLLNFLIFLYPYLLISTFPFFIKDMGGTDMTVGLAATLFSCAGMFIRPIAGYINDNYSRRVLVLLGLSVIILISLGYAFAPVLSLVLVLRLLHGFFHGMLSTSITTNACDTLPKSRFAEGMGFFGMTTALPMALAPALGITMMHRFGYRPMFLLLALIMSCALLVALRLNYRRLDNCPHGRLTLRNILNKDALPAAIIAFLAFVPYTAVSSFIALYAEQRALGSAGTYFLLWAITSTLVRLFSGRFGDRHGERIPIIAGNACFIVGLLISVFASDPWHFYIGGMIYGGGFGVIGPAVQTMSVRITPPEQRGAASSTYLIFIDLSGALGGLLSGALATAFGYRTMFIIICLSAVCSVLAYQLWGKNTPAAFREATAEA